MRPKLRPRAGTRVPRSGRRPVRAGHLSPARGPDPWSSRTVSARQIAPPLITPADYERRLLGRPCRSPQADLPVLASWSRRDCAGTHGVGSSHGSTVDELAVSVVGGQRAGADYLPPAAGPGGGCVCPMGRPPSGPGAYLLVARWEALRCFGLYRCYIERLDWVRVMTGAPGGCVRPVARVWR